MKTRTDHLSDREGLGPTLSYGLLESRPAVSRAEADGDDEGELFFEVCSAVYGGRYARVYCPRESYRMDK